MGLYSNYGPDDNSTMSLNKLSRIERHQEDIQANIEEEVKEDHFRFYGKFKGLNEEFDFDDTYELLDYAIDNLDSKVAINFSTDSIKLVWDNNWKKFGHTPGHVAETLVNYGYSDDYLDQIYDILDESNFDIHYLDNYFEYVYDLNDQDDFEELCEKYYDGTY